jgi:hypothetical protein
MLLIGGVDYTTQAIDSPILDDNVPDWGEMESFLNDTMDIKLPLKFYTSFDSAQDIPVLYYDDFGVLLFAGYVAYITTELKWVIVRAQSNTTVLFNRHIRENEIKSPYVKDNSNPADIFKESLELIGLNVNQISYQRMWDLFDEQNILLGTTNENWVTSEYLMKLCEILCARMFIYNNEMYLETYDYRNSFPSPLIILRDKDWVDYPKIQRWDRYEAEYKGTEVKFGESVAFTYSNERIPEKTVDISLNTVNGFYTDHLPTAQYIADRYDQLLSQKRYYLTGSVKMNIGYNIFKGSFIQWDGINYAIQNIKRTSKCKLLIDCISVEYSWSFL